MSGSADSLGDLGKVGVDERTCWAVEEVVVVVFTWRVDRFMDSMYSFCE